jgi:hypothetical protein
MEFPSSYDEYNEKLDAIGESILNWADPDKNFRGYTEVREVPTTTVGKNACQHIGGMLQIGLYREAP